MNENLSIEELNEIKGVANNFVTSFAKTNMTDMVQELITRSYSQINSTLNDGKDSVGDNIHALITNFSVSAVNDAITARALEVGQSFDPTNHSEALMSIFYEAASKEKDERIAQLILERKQGSLESLKTNPKAFRDRVAKVFSNLNITNSHIEKEMRERLHYQNMEAEEIIEAVADSVVEEVEETEDRQKFIHDTIQEVQEVKDEYAKAAQEEEESDDNSEDDPDLNSTPKDQDDVGAGVAESYYQSDFIKAMESFLEDEERGEESDEEESQEEDEEEAAEEGVGVTDTYQNEDVFGSTEGLKLYESSFDTERLNSINSKMKSVCDAALPIIKESIMLTYGSEAYMKKTGIKQFVVEDLVKSIGQTKAYNFIPNILAFRDYQINTMNTQTQESFETSGRLINVPIISNKQILDYINKELGTSVEAIDPRFLEAVKTKLEAFLKKTKTKEVVLGLEDGNLKIYQNWTLKQDESMYSQFKGYEDLYDLFSFSQEDGAITSFADDAIKDVTTVAPENSVVADSTVTGLVEADSQATANSADDTLNTENVDGAQSGGINVVDKSNPAMSAEEDEDETQATEARFAVPLSQWDDAVKVIKEELAYIKKEAIAAKDKAFNMVYNEEKVSKLSARINKKLIKKGKKPIDIRIADVKKMFDSLFKIADDKEFFKFLNDWRTDSLNKRWFKKEKFPYIFQPSPAALEEYLMRKAGIDETREKSGWKEFWADVIVLLGNYPVLIFLIMSNYGSFNGKYNKLLGEINKRLRYLIIYGTRTVIDSDFAPFMNHAFREFDHGGELVVNHLKLNIKLKSREDFETFFSNESINECFFPISLAKFEKAYMPSAEELSNIFLKKRGKMKELIGLMNKSMEKIDILTRGDNKETSQKSVEKLEAWKKLIDDASKLSQEKASKLFDLGLSCEGLIETKKNDLRTQAVVKNILNRCYLYHEGKLLPRIKTDDVEYNTSMESVIDLIFDYEILRRKAGKVYASKVQAVEALAAKEEELASKIIDFSPEDRKFAADLRSSLQYKTFTKFFAFDDMLAEYKSIFYKYTWELNPQDPISGDGIGEKVIKGLTSRRGELTSEEKLFVKNYLENRTTFNTKPTIYERFAERILEDEREARIEQHGMGQETYSDGWIMNAQLGKSIRERALASTTCVKVRKALGLETIEEVAKLDNYLNSK